MWLTSSSVGRKLIMSISGLFLILFLAFHMSMNLVAIISPDAYNMVCGFLGSNWYAVAGTAVLAAGVFVHFAYAILLTLQNRKARGEQRYAVSENQKSVEWSSQNMGILGAAIVLGLIVHLINFWSKMMLPELLGSEAMMQATKEVVDTVNIQLNNEVEATQNGAALILYTFKNPLFLVVYILWLLALWFHLTHGMWSAMQTMGLNNKTWMCRWKTISNVCATIVCLCFMAVVLYGFLA